MHWPTPNLGKHLRSPRLRPSPTQAEFFVGFRPALLRGESQQLRRVFGCGTPRVRGVVAGESAGSVTRIGGVGGKPFCAGGPDFIAGTPFSCASGHFPCADRYAATGARPFATPRAICKDSAGDQCRGRRNSNPRRSAAATPSGESSLSAAPGPPETAIIGSNTSNAAHWWPIGGYYHAASTPITPDKGS